MCCFSFLPLAACMHQRSSGRASQYLRSQARAEIESSVTESVKQSAQAAHSPGEGVLWVAVAEEHRILKSGQKKRVCSLVTMSRASSMGAFWVMFDYRRP